MYEWLQGLLGSQALGQGLQTPGTNVPVGGQGFQMPGDLPGGQGFQAPEPGSLMPTPGAAVMPWQRLAQQRFDPSKLLALGGLLGKQGQQGPMPQMQMPQQIPPQMMMGGLTIPGGGSPQMFMPNRTSGRR